MKTSISALIDAGNVELSRNAKRHMIVDRVERVLTNHCTGEWGAIPAEDRDANIEAVNRNEGRVVSLQETLGGDQLLVITEMGPSHNTIVTTPWEFSY